MTKQWSVGLLLFLVAVTAFGQLSPAELAPKVRATNAQYQTVAMNQDEFAKDQTRHVVMFNDAQREQARIVINNGTVYTSAGQVLPDTVNTTTNHIDHVNYIMDPDGNFYLFNEYATPTIRHSSIFDEKPVAGAGELIVKSGHITYIDSDSGHYDTSDLMPNVLAELKSDGVDTSTLGN